MQSALANICERMGFVKEFTEFNHVIVTGYDGLNKSFSENISILSVT